MALSTHSKKCHLRYHSTFISVDSAILKAKIVYDLFFKKNYQFMKSESELRKFTKFLLLYSLNKCKTAPCGFIGHQALVCESSDTFSWRTQQHQPFSLCHYNGFLADHKFPQQRQLTKKTPKISVTEVIPTILHRKRPSN